MFSLPSRIFEISFNLDKPLFYSKTFFSLRCIVLPLSILNVSLIFSTTFNDVAKCRFLVYNLSMATDKIEKLDFMYVRLFSREGLSKHFFAF